MTDTEEMQTRSIIDPTQNLREWPVGQHRRTLPCGQIPPYSQPDQLAHAPKAQEPHPDMPTFRLACILFLRPLHVENFHPPRPGLVFVSSRLWAVEDASREVLQGLDYPILGTDRRGPARCLLENVRSCAGESHTYFQPVPILNYIVHINICCF
jgi:hypothetical protein